MDAERISAYLLPFGKVPNFYPFGGNVLLVDKSDGRGAFIERWDFPDVPQPTLEDLAAADVQAYRASLKAARKAKFADALRDMKTTDPKFWLVYKMMRALSTRSDESWNAKAQEVWEAWVDETAD